ncbi:Hsp20/alpha crystallin family protein [Clostridium sp. MSJ-8]|uniref:Hsp20/alpha crystallin family protein n=1 Tax=Clostridium sp. MSJ-8 TaxID=2841510 RepID=UPI001C0ED8D5|nr:Hsp20/alpha crystallin family protein [Clostridium sp. MSJ-8]MBU5487044.1 Hsp20/alpha crystallin family protein [Clostridium sp. MSJ-8]
MLQVIPFSNKVGFFNEGSALDKLFNDFFNDDFGFSEMNNVMNVDVRENEKEYLISAELPGVNKENISLEYDNNNLTITATRENTINDDSNENYIRRERNYGTFSRSLYLENIDRESIMAKFENGELKIIAPKKEVEKSNNRIFIK